MKKAVEKNKITKSEQLKKIGAGLGISIAIMSGGFVGTHEKIGDNWLTNEDYAIFKNALIEKQQNSGYITIQEWQALVEVYDKEVKKGVGNKKFKDVTAKNLTDKLNNNFKNN